MRRRITSRTRFLIALCVVVTPLLGAACAPPIVHVARPAEARVDHDPLQPLNRKVFWFNDKVDVYVLEPVARGWDKIAPARVERAVSNFFVNLRQPIVIVNDVLQLKLKNGASDVGRFAVNSTVGIVGFLDYATPLGLEQHAEDFGQTLGWWGVPPGPYLVLPILGPSNPRDTVGLIGDSATSPWGWFVGWDILFAGRIVDTVNTRALLLSTVDEAKRASFDYYVFVRNAYLQRRNALVKDRVGGSELEQEQLYFPPTGDQPDAAGDDLYHPDAAEQPAAPEGGTK